MTDAQTFSVDITPNVGSGTVTVEIAEDAVSPGNAAVSKDFTYLAKPTVAIAFDDDAVIAGQDVDATATYSEVVTGVTQSDFSVNVGSITGFVDNNDGTFTITVTVPSTGSGTLTLTLAADGADQGNASAEAETDYAPFEIAFAKVPTTTNTQFSMELDFSHVVSGFTAADLRLRRQSGSDSNSFKSSTWHTGYHHTHRWHT